MAWLWQWVNGSTPARADYQLPYEEKERLLADARLAVAEANAREGMGDWGEN